MNIYRLTVPPSASGAVNLLVTLWGDNGRTLDAWLEVTDATGKKLAAEVIAADGNTTTLQVRGLSAGATYFVKAFSDTQRTGAYTFTADLRSDTTTIPELAAGTVSPASPASAAFTLAQTGQVHFVLTLTGAVGSAEAVVTDAAGAVVGRFAASANRGRSLDLYLLAGEYTITVKLVSGGALGFRLGVAIVTDPVGAARRPDRHAGFDDAPAGKPAARPAGERPAAPARDAAGTDRTGSTTARHRSAAARRTPGPTRTGRPGAVVLERVHEE